MPQVTSETVKQVLRDLYGYDISDDDARRIAAGGGALVTSSEHLKSLGLAGIEPPFGYPVLSAEAGRLNTIKK
jgi:hypothetical protein